MRRLSLIALFALALALPASASAKTEARGGLVTCHQAADQSSRFALFSGLMVAIGNGDQLQMKFDLLQKMPGGTFQPVQAPGLDAWITAHKGVTRFRYRKRVENLAAPASYRALVSFQWISKKGVTRAEVTRLTPVCKQPDFGPDLAVGLVSGRLLGARPNSQARYTVVVRNDGRGRAGAFGVGLSIDGVAQPVQPLDGLAAQGKQVVTFTGPPCVAGGPGLTITLDPGGAVTENHRANDVKTVACPLAG